jgi:5-methylcytosine-specific restriction endonuclease McrA
MAVQITSVKRAINLIYQGHAKVVDPEDFQVYDFEDWSQVSQQMVEVDDGEFINSPTLKIKIPRVIVLLLYDKLPKRDVSFSRKNIFERDNFQCQYCGEKPPNKKGAVKWMEEKALTFDHIMPKSRGGKTTWENIVTCCSKCNRKKGNKTPKEMGWSLIKPPVKPKWHPTLNIPLRIVPHKEWVNFLDVAYYNVELENDNESK